MGHRLDVRGVAPVVAVVLTVAIVVVLTSVFGFVLFDFQSKLNEPPPNLAVEFSYTEQGQNIYVTHTAGSSLDPDNLEIRGPGEAFFDGVGEQLTAGDRFVIDADKPSEEFQLVYTREGEGAAILGTVGNPLVGDLGGVPPQITVGYEDLELGEGNDYDYNDWAFDMGTTIAGYSLNGTRYATFLSIEFDPLARGGGYSHNQSFVPESLGSGEYDLTVRQKNGSVLRTDEGSFDENTSIFLVDSGDVFSSNSNSNHGESCVPPDRTVQLELVLDNRTKIPDNPIDADRQHGAGLPFDLPMEPSGNDDTIGVGDKRLVTVPTDWQWPLETTRIDKSYEDVSFNETSDRPEFQTNTWFEQPVDDEVYERCR
jgi:hypothetical protein